MAYQSFRHQQRLNRSKAAPRNQRLTQQAGQTAATTLSKNYRNRQLQSLATTGTQYAAVGLAPEPSLAPVQRAPLGTMTGIPGHAGQLLLARNRAALDSDTQNLASGLYDESGNLHHLDMPAANAYRQAQDTTARYASGMNYTQPLGVAPPSQTPSITAAGEQIPAYDRGVPGSSPFVSAGPLSGGPRGPELQSRLNEMSRRYGVYAPIAQPAQFPSGTTLNPTETGGIRLVGSNARRDEAGLIGARFPNLMAGVPTTRVPTGLGMGPNKDIGEAYPGLRGQRGPSIALRSQRLGDVERFRTGQVERGGLTPMQLQENRRLALGQRYGREFVQNPAFGPQAQQQQPGASPIDQMRNGMIDTAAGVFDSEGKPLTAATMTPDQAKEASTDQAQQLLALLDAGHITEAELLLKAQEYAKNYPPEMSPYSFVVSELQRRNAAAEALLQHQINMPVQYPGMP